VRPSRVRTVWTFVVSGRRADARCAREVVAALRAEDGVEAGDDDRVTGAVAGDDVASGALLELGGADDAGAEGARAARGAGAAGAGEGEAARGGVTGGAGSVGIATVAVVTGVGTTTVVVVGGGGGGGGGGVVVVVGTLTVGRAAVVTGVVTVGSATVVGSVIAGPAAPDGTASSCAASRPRRPIPASAAIFPRLCRIRRFPKGTTRRGPERLRAATPRVYGRLMAKAFSVASWNVEHFRSQGRPSRVADVVAFMNDQKPDVFALYEVEGSETFGALVSAMPKYTFHITEGSQVQEILVGVRQGLGGFFTQKVEFKSGDSLRRPGALLTVTVADEHYPLLFLHTKSGTDPKGMGLRDDMLTRALDFKKTLDGAAGKGKRAHYIFLGDFNLMGMEYMYVRERDILAAQELQKLTIGATKRKMKVLEKDATHTWWGGATIDPSNLDFVVASDHLQFKQFSGHDVAVRGWPQIEDKAERVTWVTRYSDHALLYFEVQKV